MDRTDIEDLIRSYVEEQLSLQGNGGTLTTDLLTENICIPRLGVRTRRGHASSVTGSFNKHAKLMKPYTDGAFISMPEWWRMLVEVADDNNWSLPMLRVFCYACIW